MTNEGMILENTQKILAILEGQADYKTNNADVMDVFSNTDDSAIEEETTGHGVTKWFRSLFDNVGGMLELTADTSLEVRKDELTEQTILYITSPHLVSGDGEQFDGYCIVGPYADLRDIEDPYHFFDDYLKVEFGSKWKDYFEPMQTRKMYLRSGVLATSGWGCRANIRQWSD